VREWLAGKRRNVTIILIRSKRSDRGSPAFWINLLYGRGRDDPDRSEPTIARRNSATEFEVEGQRQTKNTCIAKSRNFQIGFILRSALIRNNLGYCRDILAVLIRLPA
jgi:hypothetical protein